MALTSKGIHFSQTTADYRLITVRRGLGLGIANSSHFLRLELSSFYCCPSRALAEPPSPIMGIITGVKMSNIEAKSINIWLRYDPSYLIMLCLNMGVHINLVIENYFVEKLATITRAPNPRE